MTFLTFEQGVALAEVHTERRYASGWNVVHAERGGPVAHLLVRGGDSLDLVPPGWETHSLTLEELTLDHLREPGAAALPGPAHTPHLDAKGRAK